MRGSYTGQDHIVVGRVRAECRCCARRELLAGHPDLDATRMICPRTGRTYLDRGDGVHEEDGDRMDPAGLAGAPAPAPPGARPPAPAPHGAPSPSPASTGGGGPGPTPDRSDPDLLSDRPARTGSKTRIELERATFAGSIRSGGAVP